MDRMNCFSRISSHRDFLVMNTIIIMDLKDPRAQKVTKVMKDLLESRASRAIQVQWEAKVNQGFADSRVLKVPRELQDPWDRTGSNAFLRM